MAAACLLAVSSDRAVFSVSWSEMFATWRSFSLNLLDRQHATIWSRIKLSSWSPNSQVLAFIRSRVCQESMSSSSPWIHCRNSYLSKTTLLRDEKYSLNLLTNVLRSAPVSVKLVSAISWMSLAAQCNKIARCRPPALMPFAAKYMRTVFTYFSHLRDTPFGWE